MRHIGIIGAGTMGALLARRLVALGYEVKAANSRGRSTLEAFTTLTGAQGVDIGEVASGVDVLILSIPFGQIRTLSRAVIASLPPEALIIDSGNYVPSRDGVIDAIEGGTPETVWVSRQLGAPVVKAFNSISEVSFEFGAKPKGALNRIALPVASDDPTARRMVMGLVEDLGFDGFDAGPLEQSWRQQIGQPAYATDGTSIQLQRLLARADQVALSAKRRQAMALMARLPPDFAKQDLIRVARLAIGLDVGRLRTWRAAFRLLRAMVRRTGSPLEGARAPSS